MRTLKKILFYLEVALIWMLVHPSQYERVKEEIREKYNRKFKNDKLE